MGWPRKKYVKDGQEGVFHCFSRCVRRAYLYGYDPVTGKDFSHRKAWIVDRLRHLAPSCVCAQTSSRPGPIGKWLPAG